MRKRWIAQFHYKSIFSYVFQVVYLAFCGNFPFIKKKKWYLWMKKKTFFVIFFKRKLFLLYFWKKWHFYSKFRKFTILSFYYTIKIRLWTFENNFLTTLGGVRFLMQLFFFSLLVCAFHKETIVRSCFDLFYHQNYFEYF